MKNFRDLLYLIGIGFIAGVLFIIQCGGAVQSVADSLAAALDVSFDASGSAIQSSNVQAALKELEKRFPMVLDANGQAVGVLTEVYGVGWEIWDMNLQAFVRLDPYTGSVLDDSSFYYGNTPTIFFSNTDCTGTAYISLFQDQYSDFALRKIGDTYYTFDFKGEMMRGVGSDFVSTIGSYLSAESYDNSNPQACQTDVGDSNYLRGINATDELYSTTTIIEAKIISEPSYAAPLRLGIEE